MGIFNEEVISYEALGRNRFFQQNGYFMEMIPQGDAAMDEFTVFLIEEVEKGIIEKDVTISINIEAGTIAEKGAGKWAPKTSWTKEDGIKQKLKNVADTLKKNQ